MRQRQISGGCRERGLGHGARWRQGRVDCVPSWRSNTPVCGQHLARRARISWQRPREGMELSFHRAVWTQLERPGHCNIPTSPNTHPRATLRSPTAEVPEGKECPLKPRSEWILRSGSQHTESDMHSRWQNPLLNWIGSVTPDTGPRLGEDTGDTIQRITQPENQSGEGDTISLPLWCFSTRTSPAGKGRDHTRIQCLPRVTRPRVSDMPQRTLQPQRAPTNPHHSQTQAVHWFPCL